MTIHIIIVMLPVTLFIFHNCSHHTHNKIKDYFIRITIITPTDGGQKNITSTSVPGPLTTSKMSTFLLLGVLSVYYCLVVVSFCFYCWSVVSLLLRSGEHHCAIIFRKTRENLTTHRNMYNFSLPVLYIMNNL